MWTGSVTRTRQSTGVKENAFNLTPFLEQIDYNQESRWRILHLSWGKRPFEALEVGKVDMLLRCGASLMASCVVSYPKHAAVLGILCLGKSTCAPWSYWWPLAVRNGAGSLDRPGRGRPICSLQLHSEPKPELVRKKREIGNEQRAWVDTWVSLSGEACIVRDKTAFTTSPVQCTLNILGRGEKIDREVKGRWIISRHSIIIHSGAVEVMTALTVHPPMSCIHNMSDSQLPEAVTIIGHWPGNKGNAQ